MFKEDFKRLITELNSTSEYEALANRMLSNPIPWFFIQKYGDQAPDKYSEFKVYMANKFSVTANDISLGGSAWFGYSLSPSKKFRDFGDNSDIDIVIVSDRIFNLFWNCYLKELVQGSLYGNNYDGISKNTFKRFVDYKADLNLDISQSFYINFQKKINGYAKDLQINFDFPCDIGYRIYKSWEDYRMNVVHNLKDLRREMEKCQ